MLFHETIRLRAARNIEATQTGALWFGELLDGSVWLDAHGRVLQIDPVTCDPLVAGNRFGTWLETTLCREAMLFDPDGDFSDVFDNDGELVARVRKKRALAGRKRDLDASLYPFELAKLSLSQGDAGMAQQWLWESVSKDPLAGSAWELLASLQKQSGDSRAAFESLLHAAEAALSKTLRANRLVDAADLVPSQAATLFAAAGAADPSLGGRLLALLRQAIAENDLSEARHQLARIEYLSDRLTPAQTTEISLLAKKLKARDALRVVQ